MMEIQKGARGTFLGGRSADLTASTRARARSSAPLAAVSTLAHDQYRPYESPASPVAAPTPRPTATSRTRRFDATGRFDDNVSRRDMTTPVRTPASSGAARGAALYDSDSSDDDSGFSCGQYSVTKRPGATPGVVSSAFATTPSATAQRRRSQLALAKCARLASREKETLRQRCEHLEERIAELQGDASCGAEMRAVNAALEREIRRLELEHERATENDEWLRNALQEKQAAVALLERERGTLRARLMELEQTVAEGEACLRVAEAERDKTARRLRRSRAAEAAGWLAAESAAAALNAEVSRLHAALERVQRVGAGTNANDDDDDDSHGDDSPSGVESDWNGDSVQSDSDRDHPRASFPAAKTAHTAPGTAPRGRLGDSAMDEGSPSSANSGASVASKHQPAAAGLHERRVEYTPESKPPTRARRVVTTDPSGALAGWSSAVGWPEVDGGSVAVAARAWARALGDGARSLVVGVVVAVAVTLAMVAARELWLRGGAPGGTWGPVKGFSMRMGGMPPRARPSWREGFILV